jgi:hypothetical protein
MYYLSEQNKNINVENATDSLAEIDVAFEECWVGDTVTESDNKGCSTFDWIFNNL